MAGAMSTILGPWGLAAAAIIGVTAAIAGYLTQGEEMLTVQERMSDANSEAADDFAKTITPIQKLITEYENVNTTQDRRLTILKKLGELQPEYFGSLQSEGTAVSDLWEQYDRLTVSLLAVAKARAVQKQMTKISEEQAAAIGEQVKAQVELNDIERRAAKGEAGYAPYADARYTAQMIASGALPMGAPTQIVDPKAYRKKQLREIIDEQQQVYDDLQSQYALLQKMFDDLGVNLGDLFGNGSGGGGGAGTGVGESQVEKTMDALAESLYMAENALMRGGDAYDISKEKAQAYQKAIEGLIKAQYAGEDVSAYLQDVVEGFAKYSNEVDADTKSEEITEALTKMNEAMLESRQAFDFGFIDVGKLLEDQMANTKTAITTLTNLLGDQHIMVLQLVEDYERLAGALMMYNTMNEDRDDEQQKNNANLRAGANILRQFASDLTTSGENAEAFGQRVASGFKTAIKAAIQLAYANWLETLFADKSVGSVGKLVLGAVGFGVIDGLVNSIPALKNGGITTGPQLALVGDNRSGREAIIPLEKLPSLMQKMGGGGTGRLYSTIDGRDIVLSTERTNRMNQRTSR
jgi:hypothetical protein